MRRDQQARRQHAVLGWYDRSRRDLPWRRSADPYAVLVSEFMLQQTQVARVIEPFTRFVSRWPGVAELAAASRAAVLREWEGLGYNRRAVALHRAAVTMAHDHGGQVPDDVDALLRLPGVGPYTARAVLAFGFGRPVAPVDVNVGRVLARAFAGAPLSGGAAQELADAQLRPGMPAATRPADWSAALMDLGSRWCVARSPRCPACPLGGACAWRDGDASGDPAAASATRARPQAPFAGSDRQYRGRLLDVLRRGPVAVAAVPAVLGLPDDAARAQRLLGAVVADGLACAEGGIVRLP